MAKTLFAAIPGSAAGPEEDRARRRQEVETREGTEDCPCLSRRRWKAMVVVALSIWLASCGGTHPSSHAESETAAIAVETITAASVEWPAVYEATGTVRARTAAVVSARMMGSVREVKVQVGDSVKEGASLASLDARDLETAVRRAAAGAEEVRSAMAEAESGIAAAKANLGLAQATFARMQELYNKKSISTQEFDEAQARLKSAQAADEMAHAKRHALDAKLAEVEQEMRAAEVNRGYAEITAPFAGIVTSKSVEPGNMAMPGAPLVTIERRDGFRLEAVVEESRLGLIGAGQRVTVYIDGVERGIEARVSEIVPTVDEATRSGTVKIDLPAMGALRSGAFGRAAFTLGQRRLIAVPANAVNENGQLETVHVVENGVARTRLVTLGQTGNNLVEVLSGLSEGERVIFPVPGGLTDGARVETRR